MGFFGHHRAVPFRFENEVDINGFDTFDRFYFHFDVFHDEFGSRAIGCCEGHVDNDVAIVGFDAIDETEVVDVDWDFGVENGFEHCNNALFKFEEFVHN